MNKIPEIKLKMNKREKIYLLQLIIVALIMGCVGCVSDIEDSKNLVGKGPVSEVFICLNKSADIETRVTNDYYDNWSVASFNSGDKVGFYALKGQQNPENEELFDQEVKNKSMDYAGRLGNFYRFDNPELKLDAETVHGSYSYMYFPYYEDMPPTTDSSELPGIPLRRTDPEDGLEKCIDFMSTLQLSYVTNYRYIPLTNGMLQPQFYHHFSVMGIQRGEGFDDPDDDRIWIVVQYPYTDVRVNQYNYKNTEYFTYVLQYNPEDAEEVMVPLSPDETGEEGRKVNKYRVWECWQGADYKEVPTYYAILPTNQSTPVNAVTYIVIKDNYGRWQTVSDFYTDESGSKNLKYNSRYLMTVKMEGLTPVVKPVFIEDWNEEKRVTDDRDVGILTLEDFTDWISTYNSYVMDQRNEEYVERLEKYGDAVRSSDNGTLKWTFYINSDLELETKGTYAIFKLEDILEGSSVYTNYKIKNLRHTLINELDQGGEIHALDFDDMYIIDTDNNNGYNFAGGLIGKMNGGAITKLNINNGIFVTDKISGMLVGSITGGRVSECRISGDVIGVATDTHYPGLFADYSGNPVIEANNNFKDLNFMSYQ